MSAKSSEMSCSVCLCSSSVSEACESEGRGACGRLYIDGDKVVMAVSRSLCVQLVSCSEKRLAIMRYLIACSGSSAVSRQI